MIEAHFTISIDTNGDRHVSLPYREPKIEGVQISSMNPHVLMKVADVSEAIIAHKDHNQKRVNEILSKYY